ncbi:MAG: hypothetical protein WC955_12505 [Elusimicrobiota bacterium]
MVNFIITLLACFLLFPQSICHASDAKYSIKAESWILPSINSSIDSLTFDYVFPENKFVRPRIVVDNLNVPLFIYQKSQQINICSVKGVLDTNYGSVGLGLVTDTYSSGLELYGIIGKYDSSNLVVDISYIFSNYTYSYDYQENNVYNVQNMLLEENTVYGNNGIRNIQIIWNLLLNAVELELSLKGFVGDDWIAGFVRDSGERTNFEWTEYNRVLWLLNTKMSFKINTQLTLLSDIGLTAIASVKYPQYEIFKTGLYDDDFKYGLRYEYHKSSIFKHFDLGFKYSMNNNTSIVFKLGTQTTWTNDTYYLTSSLGIIYKWEAFK